MRQQFTLKERDTETGLDYFLARYYTSAQGRFTSSDEFTGGPDELYTFADDASNNPTFYANLGNPQSLNKYQYAFNNPLRYVDPDGHDVDDQQPKTNTVPVLPVWPMPIPEPVVQALNKVRDAITEAAKGAAADVQATTIKETLPTATVIITAGKAILQGLGNTDIAPCNECVYQYNKSQGQTEEKAKNVADAEAKGIPKDQLGPSGKPKIHVVQHPTGKRAKDAARNQGQGSPAKDASPTKGGPHYHPTNRDGTRKKGKQNIHHQYPD